MDMKACNKCTKLKPLDEFPLVAKGYKGFATHRGTCLECKRATDRVYAKNNAKRRADNVKKWIKKRKKTITFDEIKHGIPTSRTVWGCNCRKCKVAFLAYQSKLRHIETPEWYTKEDFFISIEYRFAIDNDSCFYCGKVKDQMETDHILPVKQGGLEVWWNLRRSCRECNLAKGPRSEDEFLSTYLASDELPANSAANRFYNLLLTTYPDREVPLIMRNMLEDLPDFKIRLIRHNMKALRSQGHITRKPGANGKTGY